MILLQQEYFSQVFTVSVRVCALGRLAATRPTQPPLFPNTHFKHIQTHEIWHICTFTPGHWSWSEHLKEPQICISLLLSTLFSVCLFFRSLACAVGLIVRILILNDAYLDSIPCHSNFHSPSQARDGTRPSMTHSICCSRISLLPTYFRAVGGIFEGFRDVTDVCRLPWMIKCSGKKLS